MVTQIDALVDRIERTASCEELQHLTTRALGDLTALSSSLQAQLDKIAPLLSLLTLDVTDLPSVLTFVDKLKELLTAQLAPYATLVAQAAQLAADVTRVTTALSDAATRVGSCSISVPSVPGVVVPTP